MENSNEVISKRDQIMVEVERKIDCFLNIAHSTIESYFNIQSGIVVEYKNCLDKIETFLEKEYEKLQNRKREMEKIIDDEIKAEKEQEL